METHQVGKLEPVRATPIQELWQTLRSSSGKSKVLMTNCSCHGPNGVLAYQAVQANWIPPCVRRKLDRTRFCPSNTTVQYRGPDGGRRFHGSKHLKSSQTYPPAYGAAAPLHKSERSPCLCGIKRVSVHAELTGCIANKVRRNFALHAERHPGWPKLIDHTPDNWDDAQHHVLSSCCSCQHCFSLRHPYSPPHLSRDWMMCSTSCWSTWHSGHIGGVAHENGCVWILPVSTHTGN